MSASARPHTVLTVLAGGLLALAAPAAPTGAAPPPVTVAVAPLTVPVSTAAPASPGRVTPTGTPTAPAYRIEVRNAGNSSVETTVRQELPPGTSPTEISAGGRATGPGTRGTAGPGRGTEVTWQLKLAARSAATLRTNLAPVRTSAPLAAPACAFTSSGDTPYDCATATWQAARTRPPPRPYRGGADRSPSLPGWPAGCWPA